MNKSPIVCFYMDGPGKDTAEFKRECEKFCKFNGVPRSNIFPITAGKPTEVRRASVASAMAKIYKCDRFVYFGHGWKTGIQLGWNLATCWELIERLAETRENPTGGITVVLYACSTAEGSEGEPGDLVGAEGGFADRLRDCAHNRGLTCRVVAHKTPGHTTWNPYMAFVETEPGLPDETFWVVEPGSRYWLKFVKRMKTTFRYAVPFMTIPEINRVMSLSEADFLKKYEVC